MQFDAWGGIAVFVFACSCQRVMVSPATWLRGQLVSCLVSVYTCAQLSSLLCVEWWFQRDLAKLLVVLLAVFFLMSTMSLEQKLASNSPSCCCEEDDAGD